MEYLLELLEGSDVRLRSGRRLSKTGVWDSESPIEYEVADEDAERTMAVLPETPDEPLLPVAGNGGGRAGTQSEPAAAQSESAAAANAPVATAEKDPAEQSGEGDGLTFDDPSMDWSRDDDPFAGLGPIDPEGTDDAKPRGSGGPLRRR